jgi:hypothetical protein
LSLRAVFPIPASGKFAVVPRRDGFEIQCIGVSASDNQLLTGFFCRIRGRFGAFRFEYAGVAHPNCRFDTDSADFITERPGVHSVIFPVKILPSPKSA